MKLLRLVSLAAVVMGLAFASQASAASVTYNGNTAYTYGVYGPYQLTIDGAKFDATCITAPLQVNPPKTWTANIYTGATAPTSVNYAGYGPVILGATEAEKQQNLRKAWALNQLFSTPAGAQTQAIHYAIMSVFGYSGYTDYGNYLSKIDLNNLPSADSFHVIVPTTLTKQTSGEYGPQFFITKTPEPCSLTLLGLGVAAAGIRRRRRKA